MDIFEDDRKKNIARLLEKPKNLKYKMILYSFFVGILSGLVIVAYRLLGDFLFKKFTCYYSLIPKNPKLAFVIFPILLLMALLVAYFVKKEANISGSGIPQVEGTILRKMDTDWEKVLPFKFIGGIMSMAAGLSIGREGPSIQMGAATGEGFSKLLKNTDIENKYLLTSGASAGLAAAFNAPLSGVMFALEEVHKNFSPTVLLSCLISAVTADSIAKLIIGIKPALAFSKLKIMPIKYYWSLLVLGIVLGLMSYVFNSGIILFKTLNQTKKISIELKIIFPFILAGLIGMFAPILLGGGHELIMSIEELKLGIGISLTYLIVRFIFTFISFGSGVPGGIFFPLLALGALIGNLVGLICLKLGVPSEFLVNFGVLAMAGYFASTVKAPITGIILIFEMTGSFEQLLPLSLVVFSAFLVSELIGVEPIYDLLLDKILEKNKGKEVKQEGKKVLIEETVHLGSRLENKLISDTNLPENALIVSIQRGHSEVLPRGNTKILAGDLLIVMVDEKIADQVVGKLKEMTA